MHSTIEDFWAFFQMRTLLNRRTIVCITVIVWTLFPCTATHAADSAAVLIGFREYAQLPSLPTQQNDLTGVADTLRKWCRFDRVEIISDAVVAESRAPAEGVRQRLRTEILKLPASGGDSNRLLIYLSGYAVQGADNAVYFATPDTDPEAAEISGLKFSDLLADLASLPRGCQVVVLLDCRKRGDSEAPSIGLTNDVLLKEFSNADNVVAVCASGPDQDSHIDSATNRGLFAESLIQALQGAADSNQDRSVQAAELFRFLFVDVQERCAKLGLDQSPMIKTIGAADKNDIVATYQPVKNRIYRLANRERKATASVYVRANGKRITLRPGQVQDLTVESNSPVEFYCGLTNAGRLGWRLLHRTPNNVYEFRMAQQTDGRQAWTTGFTNTLGMQLTMIYPGTFRMGQTSADVALFRQLELTTEQRQQFADESPAHNIRITRPFFIGTHEVTVAAFQKFAQKAGYKSEAEQKGFESSVYNDGTGSYSKKSGLTWRSPNIPQAPSHPAVHLTWADAERFCGFLSLQEKASYSLPTEAQWEYAARGGTSTIYWSGNNAESLTRVGNVRDPAMRRLFPSYDGLLNSSDGYVHTAPVGSFTENPFGIHDVHGNVWEWCKDWYDPNYYAASPGFDPVGPLTGETHVYRGGCFY